MVQAAFEECGGVCQELVHCVWGQLMINVCAWKGC